jgi:hypothetical protein
LVIVFASWLDFSLCSRRFRIAAEAWAMLAQLSNGLQRRGSTLFAPTALPLAGVQGVAGQPSAPTL